MNAPICYALKISENSYFIILLSNIQKGNWSEELLRGIRFIKNTKKILLNFTNLLLTTGGKCLLFG